MTTRLRSVVKPRSSGARRWGKGLVTSGPPQAQTKTRLSIQCPDDVRSKRCQARRARTAAPGEPPAKICRIIRRGGILRRDFTTSEVRSGFLLTPGRACSIYTLCRSIHCVVSSTTCCCLAPFAKARPARRPSCCTEYNLCRHPLSCYVRSTFICVTRTWPPTSSCSGPGSGSNSLNKRRQPIPPRSPPPSRWPCNPGREPVWR